MNFTLVIIALCFLVLDIFGVISVCVKWTFTKFSISIRIIPIIVFVLILIFILTNIY